MLSLAAFFLWRAFLVPGRTAVVRLGGEVVARCPLDKDGEYSFYNGGNRLAIQNGEAFMAFADCPDKICVHQGKISRTGEIITCLPHRLTVTIEGGEDEVDMVSGGGGG